MKKNEYEVVCIWWNGHFFTEGNIYTVKNENIFGNHGCEYTLSSVLNAGKFIPATKLHKALK